jgi:hypothetical protein|tara:strand:- start:694 stop:945 length:252 start_codon:yes stop_codon:yes gene_type:complete
MSTNIEQQTNNDWELGPDNPVAWSLMQGSIGLVNHDKILEIDEDGNQDHGIGKDDWGLYAFFKCSNKGKKYFVQIRQYGKATN